MPFFKVNLYSRIVRFIVEIFQTFSSVICIRWWNYLRSFGIVPVDHTCWEKPPKLWARFFACVASFFWHFPSACRCRIGSSWKWPLANTLRKPTKFPQIFRFTWQNYRNFTYAWKRPLLQNSFPCPTSNWRNISGWLDFAIWRRSRCCHNHWGTDSLMSFCSPTVKLKSLSKISWLQI